MNQRNREEGKLPQPLLASKPLSAWEQSDEKSPLFRPWCFLEEKNIHRIKLWLLILSHLHVILTDSLKTQSNPVTLETCGQRVMTLNQQLPVQLVPHCNLWVTFESWSLTLSATTPFCLIFDLFIYFVLSWDLHNIHIRLKTATGGLHYFPNSAVV